MQEAIATGRLVRESLAPVLPRVTLKSALGTTVRRCACLVVCSAEKWPAIQREHWTVSAGAAAGGAQEDCEEEAGGSRLEGSKQCHFNRFFECSKTQRFPLEGSFGPT